MKILMGLLFFFSGCLFAQVEKDSILNVYKADTAVVAGKLVRYYQALSSPCIYVQLLKPGGNGAVIHNVRFCDISGKNFSSEYSEVILEKGEFLNEELVLTLRTFPLEQSGEQIEICRFKVEGEGIAGPLCAAG